MNSPSDHLLMLRVRDGDVNVLGTLFERYHGMLLNFFMRMTGSRQTSEDLVQEVFLRILRYRGTYRDESCFATWMYKIARHAHIDHLKKHRREVPADRDEDSLPSRHPRPGEALEKEQEARLLRGALARLSPDKREVLVLSRFQSLKYQEIAAVLGCEVGAVKVRVYRAIRELREIFDGLAAVKQNTI